MRIRTSEAKGWAHDAEGEVNTFVKTKCHGESPGL